MKINLANYKTKTNTRAMTDKINNNDKINVNTVWHQKWHAHKNWAIRRPQIWTFRCCWNRQTPNREHSGARVVWPLKSQQPTPASNRQRLVKCSSIYKTLTLITTVKKKCAICLFVLVFIAALKEGWLLSSAISGWATLHKPDHVSTKQWSAPLVQHVTTIVPF